ncbi:MAG: FAD-binding protein [Betaproteobacteria bacterium]|nr:FAD-binding protein [Betaproteobacteria bacterium]
MAESNTLACDVAIVGGGISGMIAGLVAAQAGKKVRIYEKSPEERYICNSRITSGIFHICNEDIRRDPAELEQLILTVTEGCADPQLAKAVATDIMRVIRWMQDAGIRFMAGPFQHHAFMLSPPTLTPQGRSWEGRGGDVMLRTFEAALIKLGGVLHRGHKVEQLTRDNQRVVGFSGTTAQGSTFAVNARCVILADGGFQANPAITRGPISPAPDRLLQRNARTGMGDGLTMAQAAGAAITDLRGFYGHLQSRDAIANDKLWPYPWLDFVAGAGIVVTAQGKRFTDEARGGVSVANATAELPDPGATFVVGDQRIWEERGTYYLQAPNPRLVDGGGTFLQAGSLAELAAKTGIDAATLIAEVDAYNRAVAAKTTATLVPKRSTSPLAPFPIVSAPFFAIPMVAGITYTMGGIHIDANARALDVSGTPIPGLYAVGCSTGGLEGGASCGYVGGLVKSSVTGLRAGEHIVTALA